jgi:hypothetical protein
MTGARMWAAIGVHATLVAAGADDWRARLVAEVLWRASPDLRRVEPARRASVIDPTAAVRSALALAEPVAQMAVEATGRAVTVKAAGTTDDGDVWAVFTDPTTGRSTSLCVSEDAHTLRGLAAWLEAS